MSDVYVYGLDQDVIFNDEQYNHYLVVDLEELQEGNLDKAFQIDCQHQAYSNSTSFRIYYGIDQSAEIPSGATKQSIQTLCNSIAENAQELTKGFGIEWNNQNHVAVWRDEAGEVTKDSEGYNYWKNNNFQEAVSELDVVTVWDLADGATLSDVENEIKDLGGCLDSLEQVKTAVNECYDNEESGEYYFVNHELAAERVWERLQAKADD